MSTISQFLVPVGRLMWKEYRIQRSLWLAMLTFGIVPQLLIRLLASDPDLRVTGVWMTVVTIPIMFIIGSTAILFAGEREDRTCDWLLNLSVRPRWTLFSKWSFVAIAAIALIVVLSISAFALVWAIPQATEATQVGSTPDSASTAAGILAILLGFLLWGSLGSLLSRRVITAVPAMGFLWIGTLVFVSVWLPWMLGLKSTQSEQTVVAIVMLVIACSANIWLGWRWCRGKYFDARTVSNGISRLREWTQRVRGASQVVARWPQGLELPSAAQREWQRLVWQERQRDQFHKWLAGAGCFLAILVPVAGRMTGSTLAELLILVMLATPLVIGALAFRFDGEGQPLQFLANRGVRLRRLWFAKHVVWLPRMTGILSLIWLVSLSAESLIHPIASGQSVSSISAGICRRQDVAICLVLLIYGAGQLMAMLFHRSTLSLAAGGMAAVVAGLWLGYMTELQVPLWWSVGGVIVCLYGWAWWLAPRWADERRFAKRYVQAVAVFVMPPIAILGGVALWRMSEIAGFEPGSPSLFALMYPTESARLGPELGQRAQVISELKAEIARQQQPQTAADLEASNELSMTMGGVFSLSHFMPPHAPGSEPVGDELQQELRLARAAFWAEHEPQLQRILKVAEQKQGASIRRWLELGSSSFLTPDQQALLEAARLRTEEGRLEDALRYYCASLRLATFWATRSPLKYRETAQLQQAETLRLIVAWANHDDQTLPSLRTALKKIREELDLFPAWRETLVAQHLADIQTLNEQIQFGSHATSRQMPSAGLQEIARHLPWERYRAHQLLERHLMATDIQLAQAADWLKHGIGMDVPRAMEHFPNGRDDAQEARFEVTTPLVSGHSSQALFLFAQRLLIEQETVARSSMLALSLLAWKHEHGSWPRSLVELLTAGTRDSLPVSAVVDPWCGEQFQYSGTVTDPANPVVELLASVGPNQLREVPTNDPREPWRTFQNGLHTSRVSWTGGRMRPTDDDRVQLHYEEGQLLLKLPPVRQFYR